LGAQFQLIYYTLQFMLTLFALKECINPETFICSSIPSIRWFIISPARS
jgi:hypothetical protein